MLRIESKKEKKVQNIEGQAHKDCCAIKFMSAPQVELKELNNLFFELCYKACNLKCKHCYIEKNLYKQEKDFIPVEKIKAALLQTKGENLSSIYLTGGEPLLHPDFNTILRMCLKFSNVTVISNGVLINDKKARFLRKIDDENDFETIYRISLDHFDELKNDEIRGRGSFRKALGAILNLAKYEFNPIISVCNYYQESRQELFNGFYELFRKHDFEIEDINLKVMPYFENNCNDEFIEDFNFDKTKLDCYNSRVLSANGVYSCPALSNDFRARAGSDMSNYSKRTFLDTQKCAKCIKHFSKNQANDWM